MKNWRCLRGRFTVKAAHPNPKPQTPKGRLETAWTTTLPSPIGSVHGQPHSKPNRTRRALLLLLYKYILKLLPLIGINYYSSVFTTITK